MKTPSVWALPGVLPLALVIGFGFSGYAVLLPAGPMWVVHGGASTAGAGSLNGLLLAATVVTQLAVPALLRRFGWGPVFAGGLTLMGVGGALHPVSDALPYVLALAVVRGAGFGIITVASSSAAALLGPAHRRGAVIGAYGLATALPSLVLLPLGPVVVQQWGFLPVFAASALPLAGLFFVAPLAANIPQDREVATAGRPSRALIAPTAILLGVTLAGGALLTFAAELVTDARAATVALLLFGLHSALGRWQAGGLADRYGTARFMLPLVLLTVLGMTLIGWSTRDSGLPGLTAVFFLAGATGLGLSYGALQNLTLVAAFAAVPRRETHTASAVWNVGFDAGTGIGSVLVGGLAAGLGLPTAMLAAGAVSLATLPACLLVRRRELREPEQ